MTLHVASIEIYETVVLRISEWKEAAEGTADQIDFPYAGRRLSEDGKRLKAAAKTIWLARNVGPFGNVNDHRSLILRRFP